MKRTLYFAGMCCFILIFEMVLMGCPPDGGPGTVVYTVTFDSNGGSAVAEKTVASGGTITLPENPTKSGGFTFAGWFTDNNTFVNPFTASTVVTADITVYAKWTEVVSFTVTFDSNGGSAVAEKTVASGGTITLPENPTKSGGFTFVGWFTDNNTFANPFTASTVVTADITVYAKWTSQLPESVGANELAGKTYDYGEEVLSFDANGSYSFKRNGEVSETGFYSWDAGKDEVTTVIEKAKMNLNSPLLGKAEFEAAYVEYLLESQSDPESEQVPSGYTIEEYAALVVGIYFSPKKFFYTIEGGVITYFGLLKVTANTIDGLAYSAKASTESGGTHYLLVDSFDTALAFLTEKYGDPHDGWNVQDNSTLNVNGTDWVILEVTFGDIRLHKNENNIRTTKGWPF